MPTRLHLAGEPTELTQRHPDQHTETDLDIAESELAPSFAEQRAIRRHRNGLATDVRDAA